MRLSKLSSNEFLFRGAVMFGEVVLGGGGGGGAADPEFFWPCWHLVLVGMGY